MDVKTILWPTDLSQSSIKAADHVRSLATKHQARVVLLYVGLDLKNYFPAYGSYPSPDVYERFQAWEQEQATEHLNKLCSEKLDGCPALETRITTGEPATEIVNAAKAIGADLIVMSTRGNSGCTLPGAENEPSPVTMMVAKHAPMPVQTVNPC